MPRSRRIDFVPPLGGLDRSVAFQAQKPYTTPDCSNVVPFDAIDRRARLGQRWGLRRRSTQLGSGNPVRMLASVGIATAAFPIDERAPLSNGSMPSNLTAASWVPDGAPSFDSEYAYAEDGEWVGAVLDEVNIDTSESYSVSLMVHPSDQSRGDIPDIDSMFEIYLRMDDAAPDATADGVVIRLYIGFDEAYLWLTQYASGVVTKTSYADIELSLDSTYYPVEVQVEVNVNSVSVYVDGQALLSGFTLSAAASDETRVGFGIATDYLPTSLQSRANGSAYLFYPFDMAKTSDGGVIVAGRENTGQVLSSGSYAGYPIAKLGPVGDIDTAFMDNLPSITYSLSPLQVCRVLVQSDGKIVMAGSFDTVDGNTRSRILRLNADGTEDTTFSSNIGTGFDAWATFGDAGSISQQADGKLVIAGTFTEFNGNGLPSIVRLNTDGSEDTSFTTNVGAGPNADYLSATVLSSGKILVSGEFTQWSGNSRNRMTLLNADGTEDAAFYANLGTGFDSTVMHSEELSDGSIVSVGYFAELDGNARNYIVKLSAAGVEDASFYANLTSTGDGSGFVSTALFDCLNHCIQVASGNIVVIGSITSLNGSEQRVTSMLESDGTPVSSWYSNMESMNTPTTFGGNRLFEMNTGHICLISPFLYLYPNGRSRLERLVVFRPNGVAEYTNTVGDRGNASDFRLTYIEDGLERSRATALFASANGTAYRSELPGLYSSISSSLKLASDRNLQAVGYQQRLYIADYTEAANGTAGVISGSTLDDANVSDWSALGINTDDFLVEISSHDAGGTNGIYSIDSIAAGALTLASAPGDGNCTYRVCRGPKIITPGATNTLTAMSASTGTLPIDCPLIAVYLDCLVLAGAPNSPHQWYMSRQGDVDDFDYSQTDAQAAVSGANGEAGQVAEPLTCLAAWSDAYLLMGGTNSLSIMAGHPGYGGSIRTLSHTVGVIDKQAWAFTPDGEFVFLSRSGVYVLPPGGNAHPQPLSIEKLPKELLNIDPNSNTVTMFYDNVNRGIHLFVTKSDGTANTHWFIDWRTKSFWPQSYQSDHEPTALLYYSSDLADETALLMGGRDGYVRIPDADRGDDTGSTIASHFDMGPIRLGAGNTGLISRLRATLDTSSGAVDWELRTGDGPEEAFDATARWSGTWETAGRNREWRGRARGEAAVLKVSGKEDGTRWAIDSGFMEVIAQGKGRE